MALTNSMIFQSFFRLFSLFLYFLPPVEANALILHDFFQFVFACHRHCEEAKPTRQSMDCFAYARNDERGGV